MTAWTHTVEFSEYHGKPMPLLYHQPCGQSWYATKEQAARIKARHDCPEARTDTRVTQRVAS